jgi:hypothetical protein
MVDNENIQECETDSCPKLIVHLYTGADDTDGSTETYVVGAPDRADAEFHIDDYKETFSRGLRNGSLKMGSWATLSWVKNDKSFIMDYWDSAEVSL